MRETATKKPFTNISLQTVELHKYEIILTLNTVQQNRLHMKTCI